MRGADRLILFAVLCVLIPINVLATTGCRHVILIPRSHWKARNPSRVIEKLQHPVGKVFVHHSNTKFCNSLDACCKEMRSIQDTHMRTKSYGDIGYNFLISEEGKVYEGRGWNKTGAHTEGYNSKSIGVAFIGNFKKTPPNNHMMNAFKNLMDCGVQKMYLRSNRKIHTHKDIYKNPECTECPGQALYRKTQTLNGFQGGPLPGAQKC